MLLIYYLISDIQIKFQQEESQRFTCRSFKLETNKNIRNEKLFYDCPWFDVNSEGLHASFEYESTNGNVNNYRKFVFFIPKHEKLGKN